MSLSYVLNEFYKSKWDMFPSPTDTIDDYDNIVWLDDDPPSKEEVKTKIDEYIAEKPMKLQPQHIVYYLIQKEHMR